MNKFIKKNSQGTNNKKHMRRCPICGHQAIMTSHDMGRPNGHGYPGYTAYVVECSYCEIMPKATADDVYDNENSVKAPDRVIDTWNENCKEVAELLEWRNGEESER